MSRRRIPPFLRRDVRARAEGRCEYCLNPDLLAFQSFEVDHIIAEQHGGRTITENLAYSCQFCNRAKGPNLVSMTEQSERFALFNPRTPLRTTRAWGEKAKSDEVD